VAGRRTRRHRGRRSRSREENLWALEGRAFHRRLVRSEARGAGFETGGRIGITGGFGEASAGHRQMEDETPRTAEVSATASVFGNGERRRREERRQEAIARRQLLSIFPPTEEPADFSSPPPAPRSSGVRI